MSEEPQQNTDRELWREREGDYCADSIHVTENGGIGMNCGGHVIVQPIREWHRVMLAALSPAARDEATPLRGGQVPRELTKEMHLAMLQARQSEGGYADMWRAAYDAAHAERGQDHQSDAAIRGQAEGRDIYESEADAAIDASRAGKE